MIPMPESEFASLFGKLMSVDSGGSCTLAVLVPSGTQTTQCSS
jgi:hypothetical protein